MAGRSLSAVVFDTQERLPQILSRPVLSGDLSLDRRQIHQLADGIHKAFFHTDGVAGSRILFSYQVKNSRADGSEWISEIWECDWDGAERAPANPRRQLSTSPPSSVPHNPRYNNDRFLYVSYKIGQPKIYIGSLKGGQGKRLIDLRGNQLLPCISLQRRQNRLHLRRRRAHRPLYATLQPGIGGSRQTCPALFLSPLDPGLPDIQPRRIEDRLRLRQRWRDAHLHDPRGVFRKTSQRCPDQQTKPGKFLPLLVA